MDILTEKQDNNNSYTKISKNEEKKFVVTKDNNNQITISEKKSNDNKIDWSKLSWTMQNL
jgi:hypothetical protein